jgi:hypothetical protein
VTFGEETDKTYIIIIIVVVVVNFKVGHHGLF